MSQVYHSNAKTNQHIRAIIQKSHLTNTELANRYNVNIETISNRSNVYRTLKAFDINRVPVEQFSFAISTSIFSSLRSSNTSLVFSSVE